MILLDRFKIPLKGSHKDFDGTLDQTGICPVVLYSKDSDLRMVHNLRALKQVGPATG